jgi:hypothetical protein
VGDLNGNRYELCPSCMTQWEREQVEDMRTAAMELMTQDYD